MCACIEKENIATCIIFIYYTRLFDCLTQTYSFPILAVDKQRQHLVDSRSHDRQCPILHCYTLPHDPPEKYDHQPASHLLECNLYIYSQWYYNLCDACTCIHIHMHVVGITVFLRSYITIYMYVAMTKT